MSEVSSGFVCPVCGERHVLAMAFSVKLPQRILSIPPEEREQRIVITPDQCAIDNREFFLRGRFAVPVHGLEEPFIWGVWAEVSPKNFQRTYEQWEQSGREHEPRFRGYLDNEIPLYGSMLNLEVDIQTMPVGRRPHFFVVDENHPLAREQREGITMDRLEEINMRIHHPETPA